MFAIQKRYLKRAFLQEDFSVVGRSKDRYGSQGDVFSNRQKTTNDEVFID